MEPTTKLVIGIDIGGTKVAGGLVDACGEIHVRSRTPMITAGEASKGLAAVSAAIEALFPDSTKRPRIEAIGIFAPGPLNPVTGIIINPPNLAIWRNYHGRTGAAAEGGHIGIDSNGPICNCGKRGCVETLAAGPAIGRRGGQKLSKYP